MATATIGASGNTGDGTAGAGASGTEGAGIESTLAQMNHKLEQKVYDEEEVKESDLFKLHTSTLRCD